TRRWPGPATALLAGFCAAGSYAHAESTRPASLLAAAVEATAVVVFARVFGPTLEWREGPSSDLSPSPIGRDWPLIDRSEGCVYGGGRLRARIRKRRLSDGRWLATRGQMELRKGRGLEPRTIA